MRSSGGKTSKKALVLALATQASFEAFCEGGSCTSGVAVIDSRDCLGVKSWGRFAGR